MRKTSLVFMFLLFAALCSQLLAMQNRPAHKLERNNLKSQLMIRKNNAKIDATTGAVRYLYRQRIGGYFGNAEQIARAYLNDNAELFGIDITNGSLRTAAVKTTRGGQVVMFDQMLNNIPVFASRINLSINKYNEITFVSSLYRAIRQNVNSSPALNSTQATQIASDYLQVSGKLLAPKKSALMYFEAADRGFVLSWRIVLPAENPMGDWEVFVDAASGQIIHVKDMMMYHSGQGLVWDPDPLTTANTVYGGAYTDNNDTNSNALNDERIPVILQDITYAGGLYKLEGPYAVLADRESPVDTFPELADSSAFNFTRSQQNFEAVMVYYHLDLSTRRLILDLGYDEPSQLNFQVDPHGLSGDDNSHYVPSDNYCAFGEGGVDDAEDADVIWHEHAHSFQTNLTGGMAYTGETMSLQEGSSDYWAASYSRYKNDFNWGYVFSWDGHNEFWSGRRCDLNWVYPTDYVSGHDGGQIWSSALMKIWEQIGRDATDTDFIETHYLWGYAPGLQDAAEAFIQADENVYGGAHKNVIIDVFDTYGLVDKANYFATISHTPLTDTEQSPTGYEVVATITPGLDALDPTQLWVVYGLSSLTDSTLMSPTAVTNEYIATIPDLGNEIDIQYYISATDVGANTTTDPATAPVNYYGFHVGTDLTPPVITHNPLSDQALAQWPATVTATVTDNGQVDTVICYYGLNSKSSLDSFALILSTNDVYENTFPLPASQLTIGDSIYYFIFAKDASQNANSSQVPQNGFYGFQIINSKGLVLIVDDDPNGKRDVIKPGKVAPIRTATSYGKSATDIQTWLDALGYTTLKVDVATALNTDFSQYNVVISSSGANRSPAVSASYRTKLEDWVAQPGTKLLMEGGEIGYEATTNSSYGTFAQNVLHVSGWSADNSGNLQIVAGKENHPLANIPNVLPTSLPISYSAYGDQDALTPTADAYLVFDPQNQAGKTAVLVYDDDLDTTSARTVFFSFNLAALLAADAQNLLENSVEYLLHTPANIGAISGTVDLVDVQDDSGVSVFLSGVMADTILTDTSGFYIFGALPAGTYSVSVHKTGYTTADSVHSGIVVNQDTTANNNYSLDPIVSAINDLGTLPKSFSMDQNFPNPFNPSTTIRYQLPVSAQVDLTIYNAIGQKVGSLVADKQNAGFYQVQFKGTGLATGIYYYKIKAGKYTQLRKMLLIK